MPHIVLEGKGRPDEQSEQKGWWTDHWWIPCADFAGKAHEQMWVRREVDAACDVEAAIESAMQEAVHP